MSSDDCSWVFLYPQFLYLLSWRTGMRTKFIILIFLLGLACVASVSIGFSVSLRQEPRQDGKSTKSNRNARYGGWIGTKVKIYTLAKREPNTREQGLRPRFVRITMISETISCVLSIVLFRATISLVYPKLVKKYLNNNGSLHALWKKFTLFLMVAVGQLKDDPFIQKKFKLAMNREGN